MDTQMKISSKVWLGFGSILAITAALGLISVLSMMGVKKDANILANEQVPTVLIANEVERNYLKTMYNMRGYQLTNNEIYLNEGKKNIEAVNKWLKEAQQHTNQHPNLTMLKENATETAEQMQQYEGLIAETEITIKTLNEIAIRQIDNASVFMTESLKYLENQNHSFKDDINTNASKQTLRERLEKNIGINEIIHLGNEIRLNRIESLQNKDIAQEEKTIEKFNELNAKLSELSAVTHQVVNQELLKNISRKAKDFKEEMLKEVAARKRVDELLKKRVVVADKITTLSEKIAKEGAAQTKSIADSSALSLAATTIILLTGLVLAIVVGISIATIIARSIAQALISIGQRLAEASQQVRGASEQLSSAAQQLASGAAEQASSIEETTASLEEMSGMVSSNVDNAARAAELSQRVAHVSEEGNNSMFRMQESMKEILVSNEKIEALVKVISAIGEKTKVMDEIVFQTKLLSFNASVEAERAGEHGRGFAVVAQEVGNLAQMSGKAAQEIAQILSDSTKQAEAITDENKKKVEKGAGLVTETSGNLKEILTSANTVSTGANQVLEASKEQSSGIKQVNIAMATLEKSTQETAALAEEVASTSEELSAQTDMLNASVMELNELIHGKDAMNNGQQISRTTPTSLPVASTPDKTLRAA